MSVSRFRAKRREAARVRRIKRRIEARQVYVCVWKMKEINKKKKKKGNLEKGNEREKKEEETRWNFRARSAGWSFIPQLTRP